ncbi:hypothetical protein BDU57DRAFT_516459 [Ampelomyces quisqualis]|uniref:Uncharacterized protein n=1 Tax=Ampelomyces quisqualis TaxID=50730 RepID=A0A6A5QNF0_AMPQU|nr:hypothetical protein BDU57DRAFT_516459 [Ampelomyces quisqualis]
MSLKLLTLALATLASASPLDSPTKAVNDDPCEPCQPAGATGSNPPSIGSDLSSLYTDVLGSVKGINFQNGRRSLDARAESGFCCRASLDCVHVQRLNIPMCYDKFTTNYAFPDGSYGSLTTGEYVAQSGGSANLFTGNFSAEGTTGNIYSANPADRPNTSTLSIPPQFTGTGVGSAVPAGQLGSIIVYTTTIPGTTYSAPTTLPGSVVVKTVSGQAVSESVAPTTITQATTVAPQTTVVTSTGSAAPTSTGGAARVGAGVLGMAAYAIYAL